MPDSLPPRAAPRPVLKSIGALMREGTIRAVPEPPGADLFDRVARERGLRPPAQPFDHDDTGRVRQQWDRFQRQVFAAYPPWGWCPHYVGALAAAHLPRICGAIGLGPLLGAVSEDPADAWVHGIALPEPEEALAWSWRWVVDHAPRLGTGNPLLPLARDGWGLVFRLAPDAPQWLILDRIDHQWCCPALDREGVSLIELAAWRLGISNARAASRIARLCGVARPVP